MVSCVALMIQCYLVTEDENDKINSDESVFKLLVQLLQLSIRGDGYNGVRFAVIEVIEVTNNPYTVVSTCIPTPAAHCDLDL